MDSNSSSLSLSTRDAEEDGALSVAAGLSKEAALLYQAGSYVDCLKILKNLSPKKENDPKVLHNKAIVENIQDACLNPRKLIEVLTNIKKQNEVLAIASGERLDVSSNTGNQISVIPREINNSGNQVSCTPVVCSDQFDTSVMNFNIAILWFHLHDYTKSFSYLDSLFQKIEPIDEGTALHICLLLLDVSLHCPFPSRFLVVMNYIEKVFCANSLTIQLNQVDDGMSTHHQPLSKPKLPSNSTISDAFNTDPFVTSSTLEKSLISTLSEEAIEEESLQLLSSLDNSGQNLRKPSCLPSSNDRLRSQTTETQSVIDLRLKLHLYKVRFLLLVRNLKAAKREVKMGMNLVRGKDYSMSLYLKSQLEFARGNHCKAIKLLLASNNHTETGLSSMYYNNLGCIHYKLGKHHSSGLFFSKALNNDSRIRKDKHPKFTTVSPCKSLLIAYNCGVHSLSCGRPFHAARCFQKASLIFYSQPLLWLRIAECCLMALEKGLISSLSSSPDKSDILVGVIGKGKWRQLSLSYGSTNNQREFFKKDDLFPIKGNQPCLSMSLARQCLVNSLHLLDSLEGKCFKTGSAFSSKECESFDKMSVQSTNNNNASGSDDKSSTNALSPDSSQVNSNGDVKDQRVGNNHSVSLQNSITEFEEFCMKHNGMMRQAALANLAYVELGQENPLKALSAAKSLLRLPGCSRIFMFLGTMYAAEALCLLNRPKEAAEYLMTYVSSETTVELPYTQEDCENLTPENVHDHEESNGGSFAPNTVSSRSDSKTLVFSNPEEARGIFCSNIAVNFALMGNLEQAQHFITKALSDIPSCAQAILTSIFVDLKSGKTQEALTKLKQHSRVWFLPSNISLNGS